jgi:hypothetical protein
MPSTYARHRALATRRTARPPHTAVSPSAVVATERTPIEGASAQAVSAAAAQSIMNG